MEVTVYLNARDHLSVTSQTLLPPNNPGKSEQPPEKLAIGKKHRKTHQ